MGLIKLSSILIITLVMVSLIISLNISLGVKQLLYPQLYEKAIEKININKLLGEGGTNITYNVSGLLTQIIEKSLSYVRGESERENLYLEIEKNITPEGRLQQKINVLDLFDKEGTLTNAKTYVNYYNKGILLIEGLILFLTIIILLINGKNFNSSIRWVGIALIIAGIIVIIISSIIGNLLYTQISTSFPIIQPGITQLITPIFHAIKINGIITLIIGFLMLITPIFLPNKKEKEEPEEKKSVKVTKTK
ncbi:MAG: hypothetical protein AABW73_01710 [Nanoarchaeota archaeon]